VVSTSAGPDGGRRARATEPAAGWAALVLVGALAAGCAGPVDGTAPVEGPAGGNAPVEGPAGGNASVETSTTTPPGHVVRVEGDADPERAEDYRELTVEAVRRAGQLWGRGSVPVPVRLVLPADADGFAAVTGLDPGADVPAAVVGQGDEARLVVHPGAWERLTPEGHLAVLTHEVTHLVMQGDGPVPWWLGEGLAEYTAHRAGGRPIREIAGSALDGVRAGQLPETWPVPPGEGDRWGSYAMAWLACRYLAQTYSERSLVELYRVVAGGRPVEEAIPRVLGVSEAEVLTGWRAWLTSVAAG
jgi:hypothetical protein